MKNNSFNKHLKKKALTKLYDDALAGKSSVGIDGIPSRRFEENLKQEIKVIRRKIDQTTGKKRNCKSFLLVPVAYVHTVGPYTAT